MCDECHFLQLKNRTCLCDECSSLQLKTTCLLLNPLPPAPPSFLSMSCFFLGRSALHSPLRPYPPAILFVVGGAVVCVCAVCIFLCGIFSETFGRHGLQSAPRMFLMPQGKNFPPKEYIGDFEVTRGMSRSDGSVDDFLHDLGAITGAEVI